ncbi:rhomboid family intramembrane serine protease [Chitinophagaceae bacterium IBVUCB1]|nr:rhomboid family intramembrane serine protease [Chitinophagaceae bacterium IBVUCB1]
MTYSLLFVVVTVLVSLAAFNNGNLMNKLILWPAGMDKPNEYYRLITCGFIHADYIHLAFNMLALYMFGQQVEALYAYIGKPYLFPVLYLAGIIASSLPSYAKHKNNSYYRSLGASGGVSAVLFAFVYFAPWQIIYVWFLPIPGIIAAVAYLVYSAYMSKKGADNIGHDAHFWGAVFGFLFTLLFDPTHGRIFFQQLINPSF